MHLQHLFLLVVLSFIAHEISAQPPYKTLVAPILYHSNSSQPLYSITLNDNQHYLIDLHAPFTWFTCNEMYPDNVGCTSQPCRQARSYFSPLCSSSNKSSSVPRKCFPCEDCGEDLFECEDPCNRCPVTPVNSVTQSCALSQLTITDLALYWTNGRNPISGMNFNHLYVSCAPPSLLQSLPKNIMGVAAFSWSPLALSSQFTDPASLGVARKFSICLPSSSRARGVVFFGDGPYNFLPTNIDLMSLLSYTPLLKSSKSPGYYIGVEGISINNKSLPISLTNSSVKISTTVPYTTLRTDVYKHFIKRLSKGVKNIPQVDTVSPYSLCLNTSTIAFNRVGLRVPRINLQLGNGSIWSIYGPNSMKEVGKHMACLGFIDGGETAEDAIVIGSFQMENSLLYFDLEKSMFGISSTLLLQRTSCGNFNFTATPWMPPQPVLVDCVL